MARSNYSSAKRQKELKKQKRQQEKQRKKELQGTEEGERDEQALINEYLGIAPEEDSEDADDASEE